MFKHNSYKYCLLNYKFYTKLKRNFLCSNSSVDEKLFPYKIFHTPNSFLLHAI